MSTTYPEWMPGVAWLYARYSSRYGGRYNINGADGICSAGGFKWPWEIPPLVSPSGGWALNCLSDRFEWIGGASASTLGANDRFLAALGFDAEPGEVLPSALSHQSRVPPPIAVPVQDCRPSRVNRDAERAFALDGFRRGHGQTFGAVDVWRFDLSLDASALRSLKVGYVQSGRVMVSPYTMSQHNDGDDVPWYPPPDPDGAIGGWIEGQVLGFEPGEWDRNRILYRCSMLLATEVP